VGPVALLGVDLLVARGLLHEVWQEQRANVS
jgi:hypothetical protein